MAVVVALDLAQSVQAQGEEQTGRIVARRLDDGRTEFGWQPTDEERVLPRLRYFPASVGHHRWLNSSPIEVNGEEIGRINARRSEDGRIEFAFTPTDDERILPPSRYFPAAARVNRWLRSTEIAISAAPAAGFTAVSAGHNHTCAIRVSGAIECWGFNRNGQASPPDGSDFTAVNAGAGHTCGLRESGAIVCWGGNEYAQADVPIGSFTAVAAGGDHTCAIRESGAVTCWGSNNRRDWNNETQTYDEPYAGQSNAPTGSFSAVSTGIWHTCGLRESGEVECWGNNDNGQASPPAGRFSAVSAGGFHTCALRESGAIECWGNEWEGAIDPPPGRFNAVSAGAWHTCAIRAGSGEIECWGSNFYSQTDAPAGSFSAVDTGGWSHTCAIRESGAIECWGDNEHGQTDAPAP